MINETLSFRFAVRSMDGAVGQTEFRVTPFISPMAQIDSAVLHLFRMHPVAIQRFPGWHIRSIPPDRRNDHPMDVLVPVSAPRGGLETPLQPGTTYYFWADLSIPKGTFEGTYTGSIELWSGRRALGALEIELTVWPLVLPDDDLVPAVAELDHRTLLRHHLPRGEDGVSADALLQSTMRMLHRHRITPVLPELAPNVKVDARGDIAVDWGLYDSIVEPYLSGRAFLNRVPTAVWPMPLQPLLSDRLRGAELSSPRYDRLVQQYLNACAEHFIERGWLQRSYAMVPLDDTTLRMDRSGHGPYAHGHGQERADRVAARVQTFASAVRQADDRMRVLLRWFPQNLSPYGWVDYAVAGLQNQVDIWSPPAQFFDVDAMRGQRAEGRQTWLGVDRPPFSGSISIYAPPTFVRVLAWQARQLGADALDLGRINRWPDGRGAAEPVDCIRADPNVLLYPGAAFGLNEPVASVRLKQLRRSMQDAAYLRLLSEHGLEHIGKTVQESLAPYAGSSAYRTHFADGRPIGWVDDPAQFETARRVMAQELMKAVGKAPAPSRAATLRRTTAWRRLMSETRKLTLMADGCRVRWSSFRGDGAAEVECSMAVVNRTRVPVRGTIRFADLPAGWSMPNEPTRVPSIAPNESRRVVVTADAIGLPTGIDGCVSLPVVFEAEDGSQLRRDARICRLIAGRPDEEILIDGDLSDWPPGVTNVARGFRWIAEGARNSLSQRVWHGFVTRTFHRLKTGATRVTGIGPIIND
ncbi:MAG: DUF4091 domain-containing protein, partial [Planctomycetes bacterium]|nr:DUF4091 domain-containing protein [Planctomycetota bacterium]